jgi:hypothetical protein
MEMKKSIRARCCQRGRCCGVAEFAEKYVIFSLAVKYFQIIKRAVGMGFNL